jgi:hypothetical protein
MNGLKFQVHSFDEQFYESLWFSLVLAIAPICMSFLWKYTKVLDYKRRFITTIINIASIFFLLFLRHQWIANQANHILQNMPKSNDGISYQMNMPLEDVNLTLYVIIGLIAGLTISYIFLKKAKS